LELEQLQQLGLLVRGRHHLKAPLVVGQEEPRRRDIDQGRHLAGHHVQELDEIELVDERVRYLDEDLRQPLGRDRRHVVVLSSTSSYVWS
jgi:hypothetical protein